MEETAQIILPKTNKYGTPLEKMPNCPVCGEDELGMMTDRKAFCCYCSATIYRKD